MKILCPPEPSWPKASIFLFFFFLVNTDNGIKWGNAFLSCLFAHFFKSASAVCIWSDGNFNTVCLIKP